ncbi:MAG TPA: HisA/HisF-related TIM barrel protein, partial [Thermoplasmata archaeon]|nr:HisA/HisF-related TIM barrel protein [Thermoplasmata archaeon]
FDRLVATYRRIYIVDLEGVQKNEPQLDLWQELSREADLWIDGGVQLGDQAIDILVSGARRAVLSTSRIRNADELDKAWKLSQELAFEIEVSQGKVPSAPPAWHDRVPEEVATEVRASGPTILVLSFRGEDVDWELVRRVAAAGPTWVAGSYRSGDLARVQGAGARGGIFHPTPAMLLPPP